MFKRPKLRSVFVSTPAASNVLIEGLEGRQMLSASHHHHGGGDGGPGRFGAPAATIEFSQAPSAVQTGLNALAATDNVTAPTATTEVHLGNRNGLETYTVDITSTATDTRLTVDVSGNPVTAPTRTTTTFGAITNTAVTSEINAIATAQGLTAPTADTTVNVTTPSGGAAVYSLHLPSDSTTTGRHHRGGEVSVDAAGNPVGNQRLPFSVIPSAIQNALNANAPTGATALANDSTQLVSVRTRNGVTTYSTTFTATGTTTTVTVDATGKLTTLPSSSKTDFQSIPTVAQTELQALATAKGVTGTISATQSVRAYNEGNGTTLYSVTLSTTTASGRTRYVTLSVDQDGNPTVLPQGGKGGGEFAGIFRTGHRHGRHRG
jgi:hypothetical protein